MVYPFKYNLIKHKSIEQPLSKMLAQEEKTGNVTEIQMGISNTGHSSGHLFMLEEQSLVFATGLIKMVIITQKF